MMASSFADLEVVREIFAGDEAWRPLPFPLGTREVVASSASLWKAAVPSDCLRSLTAPRVARLRDDPAPVAAEMLFATRSYLERNYVLNECQKVNSMSDEIDLTASNTGEESALAT